MDGVLCLSGRGKKNSYLTDRGRETRIQHAEADGDKDPIDRREHEPNRHPTCGMYPTGEEALITQRTEMGTQQHRQVGSREASITRPTQTDRYPGQTQAGSKAGSPKDKGRTVGS